MKIPFLSLTVMGALLLSSCKLFQPGEYTPEYLRETSALDGPGVAAAREALRAKMLKEGSFHEGDTPEIHQGKVYLFNRNPDTHPDARGKMTESATAKIIACEGLYYFVELDNGSKGFLRESDLVNPVQLVSTSDFLPGTTPGPDGWGEGVEQPDVVELDGNQKLMTNDAGRTVVVVGKKSERNEEFEARKKALMEGKSADDSAPLPAPADDIPLPEPSGTFGE